VLIRFQVVRRPLDDGRSWIAEKPHAQFVEYGLGDFFLDRKYVVQVAVIALGPQLIAVAGVDELHRDAQTVAGLADASFEHCSNLELVADLPDIDCPAPELKRGAARGDAEAFEQ
jgi:hypothetical protein